MPKSQLNYSKLTFKKRTPAQPPKDGPLHSNNEMEQHFLKYSWLLMLLYLAAYCH